MLKKWFSASLIISIVVVILLSLPGISDLFKPGFFNSHDGEGHIIRMDEFYHAFLDGQFPVRWSKRLYYGYGYPFFNFNYPSTYYFGVPIMLLGFSATTAMKSEMISMYLLSAVVMFLYLRRKVSWPFAIAGAVLYSYAPYRFINIYVRGSVAESTAFLFPPLLLWTAEMMTDRKPKAILLAALTIFLLGISHNISALLLFGFFFTYLIFLSVANRSLRPFLSGLVAFGLGLLMAAFFFVPALTEKKYTFLDQTIAKDYPDHFVYLFQLVKGGWGFGSSVAGPNDGLSFNIGWMQLGIPVLGCGLLFWWRKFKAAKVFYHDHFVTLFLFTITIVVGSIFFMLPISKIFWDHVPLLPFVQFPWRFLLLTVPVLSVMSAVVLQELTHAFKWNLSKQVLLLAAVILGTFLIAKDEWHINQVFDHQTVSGDALLGSTTWANEQATHWFVPMPTKIPAQKIEFINDTTQQNKFEVQSWLTGVHTYSVTATSSTTVAENTMYYPGWIVSVDGKNVSVDYQNKTFPGLLVYQVPAGQHLIVSRFTETPLRETMDIISAVTLIVVCVAVVWPKNLIPLHKKVSLQTKRSSK